MGQQQGPAGHGVQVAKTVANHSTAGDDEVQPMPESLKSLAIHRSEGPDRITGIDLELTAKELVRDRSEPRVMIEGKRWRLNPNRPNFHPRAHSKDLEGHTRNRPSLGALAPAASDER